MIVHQTTTSNGEVSFAPFDCPNCRMNSAGSHEKHCPFKEDPGKKPGFIPDPVEDYDDYTEVL